MKRLTRKNRKMSLEAYAVACLSPDTCIYGCMSGTPALQSVAQVAIDSLAGNS